MTRRDDYAYYLADSGARVAIVHRIAVPEFIGAACPDFGGTLVLVGGGPPGARPPGAIDWERWMESDGPVPAAAPTLATDPAFFLYTSGSTGSPKAAVHAHGDVPASVANYALGVLSLRAGDRLFSVSKLFFAYGLGNGLYFPLATGASVIQHGDRPRPETVLALVTRYRPTVFFAVPTFYAAVLRAVEQGLAADFSPVRLAVSAGEALPAEVFERFRARFGLEILDGIGSTELLHIYISGRPGRARPGTCGTPVPGYEVAILDDAGAPVPPGTIGDLFARGPSLLSSYWNKPAQTRRAIRGGWLATGDNFFCDADGYYHHCGRSDDMLKVSGMWVSPSEVENALLACPDVAEAAVVGRVGADGLTVPVAYVVRKPGPSEAADLEAAIRADLRLRLPAYKCPQAIRFLDALPKTATGKLQRYKLRQLD